MVAFKCWGCEHYNDGEGRACCLSCGEIRFKDYSNMNGFVYLEPGLIEESVPSTEYCDLIGCLNEQEFTVLYQRTLGKMSIERIAKYNGVKQRRIYAILDNAKKKIKDRRY